MRKALSIIAVTLVAGLAAAAPTARPETVAGAPWVTRAIAPRLHVGGESAFSGPVSSSRPIVLIETNYYTFLSGDPLQVRITTDPNGFTGPATMYLYRENRSTGVRNYYNIPGGGLQTNSKSIDLFGTASTPVAVNVPTLSDFVLFGSASDTQSISFKANGALGPSFITPAAQTGFFQWVIEIRDAAGQRVISRSNAMYSFVGATVDVSGQIANSTTWTADKRYVLHDFVGVVAPATLTIQPGTVIYGGDTRATLFIQRGAKIIADGTARRPIIFSSPQKTGDRAQRDWGSLVILGAAPINEVSGQAFFEGLPAETRFQYGGTDPHDSSGIVRYVRLEFGGFPIEVNQEINGLSNAGVGDGTVEEYIEVLHNKDDCFEEFGGTVNMKHLLGVACADDGLDFDLGYSGKVQFVALIHRPVNDESDSNVLTESDNHPTNFTLTPTTLAHVYNVTGYRPPTTIGHYGAVLRRGTGYDMHNAISIGSLKAPVTIRDDASFNNVGPGKLVWNHSILFGDFSNAAFPDATNDRPDATRTFLFTTMDLNRNVDPLLAAGAPTLLRTLMPDLSPLPGSPALDAAFVGHPPDDGFFEQVDFIGAVGAGDNWVLSGWANFSDN
jgi:hypothetical protein